MNFIQRFNIIIDIIEKNLKKQEQIGKCLEAKLAYKERDLGTVFSFIVGDTMGTYIRQRRLAAAYEDYHVNERKMEDVAEEYGYGYRGSFERAFKNQYGSYPNQYEKSKNTKELVKPLYMGQLMNEKVMDFNPSEIFNDDASCLEEQAAIENISTIDLKKTEDIERIERYLTCQTKYGLKIKQIMVLDSIREKECSLDLACSRLAEFCPGLKLENITEQEKNCIYLVITYGMTFDTAKEFVDIQDLDVKKIDLEYLLILDGNGKQKAERAEKISYESFRLIKDKKIIPPKKEWIDFVDTWHTIAEEYTTSEIEEIAEWDSLSQYEKDILYLICVDVAWPKSDAVELYEKVKPYFRTSVRELDVVYLGLIDTWLISDIDFPYGEYLRLKEIIDSYYIWDKSDICEIITRVYKDGMKCRDAIEIRKRELIPHTLDELMLEYVTGEIAYYEEEIENILHTKASYICGLIQENFPQKIPPQHVAEGGDRFDNLLSKYNLDNFERNLNKKWEFLFYECGYEPFTSFDELVIMIIVNYSVSMGTAMQMVCKAFDIDDVNVLESMVEYDYLRMTYDYFTWGNFEGNNDKPILIPYDVYKEFNDCGWVIREYGKFAIGDKIAEIRIWYERIGDLVYEYLNTHSIDLEQAKEAIKERVRKHEQLVTAERQE